MKSKSRCAVLIALALWMAGCTVGPKYQRAAVPVPLAWKPEQPFRAAAPKDAIPRGAWWSIFDDSDLDGLEQQAIAANQTIQAAEGQLRQARASAEITAAGLYPALNATPSAERERLSGSRPVTSAIAATKPLSQNIFALPFTINYDVDLFGGARRNVQASNALYQSSAAGLDNVRLTIAAELAADYFMLRELDAEIAVVNAGVEYEARGLRLVENRHNGGIASGLDVAQQKALLDATQAQAELLAQQRAQFEHALAALVGRPASSFSLPAKQANFTPPSVPSGVPSDVLERRPDIAAAERQMAAQNALVGVAQSAFYPSVNLFGGGGYQSVDIARLFNLPSAVWSLGAGLTQPVLNGGRNRANLEYSRAGYAVAVANYRQSVLTAFQQVEDGLAGLSVLERAAATQQAAVEDAQTALRIANDRYVGGVATYLDVISAQEALLSNQRVATQLLGQRMLTSVYLVKALGGGWDASSLSAIGIKPSLRQTFTP